MLKIRGLLVSAEMSQVLLYISHYFIAQLINLLVPIRMPEHEELLGADYLEHEIRHESQEVTRAVELLRHKITPDPLHPDQPSVDPEDDSLGRADRGKHIRTLLA